MKGCRETHRASNYSAMPMLRKLELLIIVCAAAICERAIADETAGRLGKGSAIVTFHLPQEAAQLDVVRIKAQFENAAGDARIGYAYLESMTPGSRETIDLRAAAAKISMRPKRVRAEVDLESGAVARSRLRDETSEADSAASADRPFADDQGEWYARVSLIKVTAYRFRDGEARRKKAAETVFANGDGARVGLRNLEYRFRLTEGEQHPLEVSPVGPPLEVVVQQQPTTDSSPQSSNDKPPDGPTPQPNKDR